ALTAALASGNHDQIVVASPNGAKALATAVEELTARMGCDAVALPPVACVGPSTAAKLDDSALRVNIVPGRAVAEGLVEVMPEAVSGRDRLLLVQAEVARGVLEVGLGEKGWNVDRVVAYRTIDAQVTEDDRALARTGDIITFASSSAVERFVRLVGRELVPPVVASIGPITSATATELGLNVMIEAEPHTVDGLVAALVMWATSR
ncbi:MAG: uroporphyrinogen-III synthase, partial [Acidimicrobiaceae bacterium]|nr:uroporphyrinogen-III synthase [Acidimicrobiaceae bacterium]